MLGTRKLPELFSTSKLSRKRRRVSRGQTRHPSSLQIVVQLPVIPADQLFAVVGGLFELLPVLLLLLLQLPPAVTGGLFELFVVVLQVAATLPGDIAFGDVGDSLHPIITAVANKSAVPMILIASPLNCLRSLSDSDICCKGAIS
jgi:hypothetical protein